METKPTEVSCQKCGSLATVLGDVSDAETLAQLSDMLGRPSLPPYRLIQCPQCGSQLQEKSALPSQQIAHPLPERRTG